MNYKSPPFITVLMSVYNNEKTVGNAINSIINQSFQDFEFLIVNDGSSDNTRGVIQSFRDNRIKILDNRFNMGLTGSLNRGLEEAKGRYIARIDADDISLSNRLEKQVLFLSKNPEFILLGTSFNITDKKHRVIKEVKFNINPEKIYYDITFQNLFAHSSVIFRLSDAFALGGYDRRFEFSQDYDLWYKFTRRGRTWILPDILTLWCDESGNISNKEGEEQRWIYGRIFTDNLKKLGINEETIKYAFFLHNFNDSSFLDCPGEEIHNVFKALLRINKKLIDNAPDFYDKSILEDICYQNVIDLLTRIYKNTDNKSKVISFLLKNILNLKLDRKFLLKILNFVKI